MRPIQLLSLAFILLSPFSLSGQSSRGFKIIGVVTDAETGESLPSANIFLANTVTGTSSDENGEYQLELHQAGLYDLVISFVGYETFVRSVNFQKPETLVINAKLETKANEVDGTVVTPRKNKEWNQLFRMFKVGFLGQSENAVACQILNEEVLNFDFDDETGVFEAWATEPLKIENKKLGYNLTYVLEHYRVERDDGYISLYGFPRFEEIAPKSRSMRTKYERAREVAYNGSVTHFFRSLFNGTLEQEGFELRSARDVDGQRVIDQEKLDLSSVVLRGQRGRTKRLKFQELIYVYYLNEEPSFEFRRSPFGRMSLRSGTISQVSYIEMMKDKEYIEFEGNGYVLNPLDFYSYGYWLFEKVGDMMPFNFKGEKLSERRSSRR